jgi:hypothetical protein
MATGLGENVSQATVALMSQVPPPSFCATVVRLIALQILAVGVINFSFYQFNPENSSQSIQSSFQVNEKIKLQV